MESVMKWSVIFFLALCISNTLYQKVYWYAYFQAKHELEAEFKEGIEGYCFADVPNHPGKCK